VNVLVSLLTPEEEAEFLLASEGELCRQAGIEFHAFPIGDRELPSSRDEMLALAHRLAESVREGKAVAIHCRAGIGRSTMLAAGVLTALGETPERALERIAKARRGPVPDTPEQRQWILDLARARIPA
jgi:protein-tyrosine phosphatase